MIRRAIFYGDDFWKFYYKQNQKVRNKINWTIGIVKEFSIIPENYFKHIESTDLYEIRVSHGSNIYRILCFFDSGSLVILLNAFQKKDQKLPKKEIDKALKLKEKYNEDKEK
ncbi:MAG: type II toxin-antitoxin system RelE/ParE family toxin [Bacteroidetes bacterium]|nr:type II toxin-antitoxin system RelE/ParE family toxin [Bacteroidota bacterium]